MRSSPPPLQRSGHPLREHRRMDRRMLHAPRGDKHTINSVIMTNNVHTFHETAARGVRSAAPVQRPPLPLRPPLESPRALKGVSAAAVGGGPTKVGTNSPSNGTGGALSPRTLVLLRRPSPAALAQQGVPTPSVLRGGELRGLWGFDAALRASSVVGGTADKFTNCLMKSGNRHVAEKVLSKASMFIKMNPSRRRGNQFGHLVREAILQVKPLVELNVQGTASARSRRKKPKAIPMSSRRGEKLAIQ